MHQGFTGFAQINMVKDRKILKTKFARAGLQRAGEFRPCRKGGGSLGELAGDGKRAVHSVQESDPIYLMNIACVVRARANIIAIPICYTIKSRTCCYSWTFDALLIGAHRLRDAAALVTSRQPSRPAFERMFTKFISKLELVGGASARRRCVRPHLHRSPHSARSNASKVRCASHAPPGMEVSRFPTKSGNDDHFQRIGRDATASILPAWNTGCFSGSSQNSGNVFNTTRINACSSIRAR